MRLWFCFVALLVIVAALVLSPVSRAQCPGGVCPAPSRAMVPQFAPQSFYAPQYAPQGLYAEAGVYCTCPAFIRQAGVIEVREYAPPAMYFDITPHPLGGYYMPQQAPAAPQFQRAERGRIAYRQRIR